MSMLPIQLPPSSNVLIAGAGGGFDFLCGLPIVLELEAQGHTVHIANYSFTRLNDVRAAQWHTDYLLEISHASYLETGDYFPEVHLAKWYNERRRSSRSIWCLAQGGVKPTLESYNYLIAKFNIDVVICIDGGVDGIFRGDEHDLGTPSMDSISVAATSLSTARTRIYACTAFGTEGAEGEVSHAQALNRMADLTRAGAFLGVGTMRKNSKAGGEFLEAVDYIFSRLSGVRRSIIVSTLVASMNGAYGRQVVHDKTQYSPPWISPLTSLIWYFEAETVAHMKLFYDALVASTNVADVAHAIEELRQRIPLQPHESISI